MRHLYEKLIPEKRYKGTYADFPSELIDGVLITEALLKIRLPLQLLPRQMVVGYLPSGPISSVGFTHGVPGSSSLAGVTFLSDRRVRRALLQKHGMKVPEGATFSYESKLEVVKYIRRIGYPVVIKEAMAQELGERGTVVNNAQEFDAVIKRLRVVDERMFSPQADYKNSAYAITGLLPTVTAEDGIELKNEKHRFLIEQHVPGDKVRLIVVHGSVVCALSKPENTGYDGYNLLKMPHRYQHVAEKVMNALPGIRTLCIDIVVDNIAGDVSEQQCCIVEVSERLHLHNVLFPSARLAKKIASSIVENEVSYVKLAAQKKMAFFNRPVTVPCKAKGLVDCDKFKEEVDKFYGAKKSGLVLEWQASDAIKGQMDFVLKGGTSEISSFLNSLSCGHGVSVRPMSIDVF